MKIWTYKSEPFCENTEYWTFWVHYGRFLCYVLWHLWDTSSILHLPKVLQALSLRKKFQLVTPSLSGIILIYFFRGFCSIQRTLQSLGKEKHFWRFCWSDFVKNWHTVSSRYAVKDYRRKIKKMNFGSVPGSWNPVFRVSFGDISSSYIWTASRKVRATIDLVINKM